MIKVLHYYPKEDAITARCITLLTETMSQRVESEIADSTIVFKKKCKTWHPDIVHIYGDLNVQPPAGESSRRVESRLIAVSPIMLS